MDFEGVLAIVCIFIVVPWLGLHYITKWKQAPRITEEDERMLDDMYNLARRLEERVNTVERIVAADNPDFKPSLSAQQPTYQIDRRN